MSTNDPQMKIRLPIELKDKVQKIAKRNGTTMNAQIIKALSDYVVQIEAQVDELDILLESFTNPSFENRNQRQKLIATTKGKIQFLSDKIKKAQINLIDLTKEVEELESIDQVLKNLESKIRDIKTFPPEK